MIGASGAIAGVLGGYLLLFPRARILTLVFIFIIIKMIRIPALIVLGFWFFIQLLSVGGAKEGNVAWFAHIGGFVAGLILVKVFQPRALRGRKTWA
jgi:membrane associated rhomboid family serine protease